MFFSFLITILAGISTFLGSLIILFKTVNKDKIISISMYFTAGVIITVSVIDLAPAGLLLLYNNYGYLKSFLLFILSFVMGIIISKIIDIFSEKSTYNSLYNAGLFSLIAIVIHNIPEGIATFLTTTNDISLGISFAIAIALHNIPEGITIAVPIYYSMGSKRYAFLYAFIAGISEFFGAVAASMFLTRFNINAMLGIIYPIIAGIMLFLSIEELIPNAREYDKQLKYKYAFLIGTLFMTVVCFVV